MVNDGGLVKRRLAVLTLVSSSSRCILYFRFFSSVCCCICFTAVNFPSFRNLPLLWQRGRLCVASQLLSTCSCSTTFFSRLYLSPLLKASSLLGSTENADQIKCPSFHPLAVPPHWTSLCVTARSSLPCGGYRHTTLPCASAVAHAS